VAFPAGKVEEWEKKKKERRKEVRSGRVAGRKALSVTPGCSGLDVRGEPGAAPAPGRNRTEP
jgi:predicted nucleic acid-binding Zn ribbon protein